MGHRSSKHQQASAFSPPSQYPVKAAVVVEAAISPIDTRELALARREADLQARRREAARDIRRQHRESVKFDLRLAGIESLISRLTECLLEPGRQPIDNEFVNECAEEGSSNKEALQAEILALRDAVESLTWQNEQLAGNLAQSSIRQSIGKSSDADATMSWEQRKAMIFAQDDANATQCGDSDADDVKALRTNLDRLRCEVQARDLELAQLRDLLEQRPTIREEGTAIGAAAIAQMMDSDELVQEERQRLQELQTTWEAKFRKIEIAASIERANLARERQQLERQNAELEEQLAHLKRELRQEEITGPNQKRRWFAKLGLTD